MLYCRLLDNLWFIMAVAFPPQILSFLFLGGLAISFFLRRQSDLIPDLAFSNPSTALLLDFKLDFYFNLGVLIKCFE